jgi:formylglycine-generating enzyme required for sulfatase activity
MTLRVTLPRERVPDGFVYVPAGTFLQGSDDHQTVALTDHRRNFLRSPPMHEETTGAYLIGKYEVTFAEWLRYLRAIPDDEREKRRQKDVITGKTVLSLDPVGRDGRIYRLTLLTIDDIFEVDEGQRLEYPNRDLNQSIVWENSPAAGVTFEDAAEYTKWLSQEVPGARPCTSLEWERAARGADGRIFPHGDRLRPEEANVVETYDHNHPGPDEVGTHPQSASPFGIMDMSGNVSEWVQDVGDVSVRGGSWFFSPPTAVTTNITAGQPARHEAFVGLRVCADPPAVTETGAPRSSR